ncbi:hypothetical protein DCC61_02215 [Candidatus Microgenomates bacterium]|nr:MAG: hypothetical protein DCC61_02215 [Candidatus Microgenomates bacterium]
MLGKIVSKPKTLFLLIAVFFITLAVSLTTHLFEVPDENAHYATVHYLYNQGRMPERGDKNTHSLEEYKVEEIMGTLEGKNKYSYHPEYRIEQIDGVYGKYEELISSLNNQENKSNYAGRRAAIYPPLYYVLAQPFYAVAEGGSLIDRIFSVRFLSILITVATVYFVYLIGVLVIGSVQGGVILSSLFILYPMTTYVGGGINSDNLHNLFTTIFTYLSLIVLLKGWTNKLALTLGIIVGLDLLTKPQGYILLPIILLLFCLTYKQFKLKNFIITTLYIALPILILAGYQEIPKLVSTNPYIADSHEIVVGGESSFIDFSKGYIKTHLTEMPVWYWGVFKWFGLTLPKPFWWLATRLLMLSAIGVIISLWKDLSVKKISIQTKFVLFAIGANLIYAFAIFFFDWQFFQQFGRSLGLQARYYMPLLATQLALIYIGIKNLTSHQLYSRLLISGLVIFFVFMHLAGFYTQLSGYYDFTSPQIFLDQLSQYKPDYAKGAWWYLWGFLYLIGVSSIIKMCIKSPFTEDKIVK